METQTLKDHLLELRRRLTVVALFVLIGSTAGYFVRKTVLDLLLRPLEGETLIYTSPHGGFEFLFKIILFVGFLAAVPIAAYQLFKFLAPALPKGAEENGAKFLTISVFLAAAGIVFSYMVALPASLHFLSSIGEEYLDAFISTNEYLSFFMIYILGFAVIFQLPLIMSVVDKNKPLKPGTLMRKQKYVIIGGYVVAAILTPTPDAMNQTIMALPIVLLYQLGILVIWYQHKRSSDLAVDEGYLDDISFSEEEEPVGSPVSSLQPQVMDMQISQPTLRRQRHVQPLSYQSRPQPLPVSRSPHSNRITVDDLLIKRKLIQG